MATAHASGSLRPRLALKLAGWIFNLASQELMLQGLLTVGSCLCLCNWVPKLIVRSHNIGAELVVLNFALPGTGGFGRRDASSGFGLQFAPVPSANKPRSIPWVLHWKYRSLCFAMKLGSGIWLRDVCGCECRRCEGYLQNRVVLTAAAAASAPHSDKTYSLHRQVFNDPAFEDAKACIEVETAAIPGLPHKFHIRPSAMSPLRPVPTGCMRLR